MVPNIDIPKNKTLTITSYQEVLFQIINKIENRIAETTIKIFNILLL